ncbi:putative Dynein regulatory complex protein 1 [Hypsibius exemplaris]|uniref:Dynein regulatory complex protein 1 n=1 Tax=Hypsibius exemplaris TaxID=2072580 RepID=A0A9X6NPR7_HYPEX|nr:putative Dynein regulatory complex protein 1 [Hypsibius exemplaris]
MSHDNLTTFKESDGPASQVHLDALFGQFQERDPITEFPRFQNFQVAKKGSGVLSNIREERIMARRKRLEQRLLMKDNEGNFDDSANNASDRKDQTRMPTFAAVFESTKNFRRNVLRSDHILRSYVKASCRRRVYRNQAVTTHFDALDTRIKNNQWLCRQRMSSKFAKYAEMGNKTLCVEELSLLLQKYKTYGSEIIKSKQAFVDEIEDELKAVDENFARMLKSFHKDIDGIGKRATEFCTKLTSLCRKEIYDLDKTFSDIEHDYTKNTGALWDKGHAEIAEKNDAIMARREELMEEILNNMKVLRTAKLDSILEVKFILDNDVLLMTEQLQNMRASFLVNAEKLDYNLEIIQLREEESVKTKNKQKRIITKIQDELARTTNELRADEKMTVTKLTKHKSEYIVMTTELVSMHQAHDEAVNKEWQMFRDCWISNEMALRDTLRNLLLIDRFITEEISNHKWEAPPLWFLTHIGPIHGPRWRATMAAYKATLTSLRSSPKELAQRLDQDRKRCWAILNPTNRRLAQFRSLSLVSRPPLADDPEQKKPASSTDASPYELPSYILGPVLRWIVSHLDFFNEDYTADVVKELNWQDRFSFQMQAFLNEFRDFNYDDVCRLALFFLRFSHNINEKQATGHAVNKEDMEEWLRNLTPEEMLGRRVEFNDVFEALHAYLQHKRHEVYRDTRYDLVKARGRGRDTSADADYLNCYLNVIDPPKKTKEWDRLLCGIRKELQISEKKLTLTDQTKILQEKNKRLKSLLKNHISNKDDAKFMYPPLCAKMDIVAEELCRDIGQWNGEVQGSRLLPWHRRLSTKNRERTGIPLQKSQSWSIKTSIPH